MVTQTHQQYGSSGSWWIDIIMSKEVKYRLMEQLFPRYFASFIASVFVAKAACYRQVLRLLWNYHCSLLFVVAATSSCASPVA